MLSGSLSPSFRNNSNSSASVASDSGYPHKILSRSSVVSKPSQTNYPEDVNQQIAMLKEKAHQSFMQVIQIQQLHEEEIEDLKRQFQEKQGLYIAEIAQLKQKVEQLIAENGQMYRNNKQHICQFSGSDLLILDSIDPINCQDQSKLDESSINSFIELVAMQGGEEHLKTVRQEMINQLKNIPTENHDQIAKVQTMIDRLFEYITHLKREFIGLQDALGQVKNRLEKQEQGNVSVKQSAENLQKENKFMSDQIKRLAGEKMKIEKKSSQQEKVIKKLEDQVKKIQQSNRKGFKSQEVVMKKMNKEQNNDSMDLNDFIEHNMNTMMRSQPVKQPKWLLSKAHH